MYDKLQVLPNAKAATALLRERGGDNGDAYGGAGVHDLLPQPTGRGRNRTIEHPKAAEQQKGVWGTLIFVRTHVPPPASRPRGACS